MKCEFDYCIYQRDGKCTVGGIQINSLGMCDECVVVSLEGALLEEGKRKHFENIERRLDDEMTIL